MDSCLVSACDRTDLVQYLPLSYTASLDQLTGMWRGEAVVPASYLPQNVDRQEMLKMCRILHYFYME